MSAQLKRSVSWLLNPTAERTVVPIYTPRGLKVRLSIDFAFALMARLYPKVSAFEVLKTTEGIESLPQALAFLSALICFFLKLPPLQIGLIVFIVTFLFSLMTRYGFYVFPSIVKIGTVYSYLTGFGLLLIILCVLGFYLVGWRGVLAYFTARFLEGVIAKFLDVRESRMYLREIGEPITASERNFINAYRLHANKVGVTVDVSVADEEREKENWETTFTDLALKYPEVVSRLTVN